MGVDQNNMEMKVSGRFVPQNVETAVVFEWETPVIQLKAYIQELPRQKQFGHDVIAPEHKMSQSLVVTWDSGNSASISLTRPSGFESSTIRGGLRMECLSGAER